MLDQLSLNHGGWKKIYLGKREEHVRGVIEIGKRGYAGGKKVIHYIPQSISWCLQGCNKFLCG